MMRRLAALGLLAAACADPAELGVASQEIIGGFATTGHPSVVQIESTSGLCTGTLITPTVVLTAAHCVYPSIQDNTTSTGTVSFGSGEGDFFATVGIADMWAHRYYEDSITVGFDIGLVRLDEPAPTEVPLLPYNTEYIDDTWLGTQVTVVGFGVTDGEAQTGAGTKRQVNLTIDEVRSDEIGLGLPNLNICQGDSGGPTLLDNGDSEVVLAVSSYGSNFCMDRSYCTRTDVHLDDGLREVVAAWTEPCDADGTCVTEGCGDFEDPDCNECGFDGFCLAGCPTLDLDCPVTGRDGDFCEDADGCESRLCIAALDDASVSYCSVECDPGTPGGGCQPPLTVCQEADDGNAYCYYNGITPGTQGAPCSTGDDCRSGVCHPDLDICIEECGDGLPECREPYHCGEVGGSMACVPEEEGGGCGCRAGGGDLPGIGVLVLLLGLLYRRSRPGPTTRKAR